MSELILYTYYRSSATYRVRIVLNYKSIPYKSAFIHLARNGGEQHSAKYSTINPNHLVPTLQDGDDYHSQSMAIIDYLEECYPDPPLLPKSPHLRAQIRAFALTIACEMQPLNNLRVLKYLEDDLNTPSEKRSQWYQHWIKEGFTALETRITKANNSASFCFGDAVTQADVLLIPQVYNALRFNCPLSDYPRIATIYENCMALAAFQTASPEQQGDYEPS